MQKRGKQRRGPGWERNPKSPPSSLSPPTSESRGGWKHQCVMCLLPCPQCSHGYCCLHSSHQAARLLSCRFPGTPGRDGAAGRFTAVSDEGTFPARASTKPEKPPNNCVHATTTQRDSKNNFLTEKKNHLSNSYCSRRGFANISVLFNKSGEVKISMFVLQMGKLRQGTVVTYSKSPAEKRQSKDSNLSLSNSKAGLCTWTHICQA